MEVFVDASSVSQEKTGEECCLALTKILAVAKAFHTRARCKRLSWVACQGSYSHYELIPKAKERKSGLYERLSASEKRDMRALAIELATGFKFVTDNNIRHTASCSASLVWTLLNPADKVVVQYVHNGCARDVVVVSKEAHLRDDAVCRVLYCNHPDVSANASSRGFESQSHDDKHFLATSRVEGWIEGTEVVNPSYREKVSKFCPGIVFGGDRYLTLERLALRGAMQKGKYALDKMDGHVYQHEEVVGASEGKMTSKVCVDTCNRDVHMYPVPETTPCDD